MPPSHYMLRPRKKYTVFDLQQLKGKRVLTPISGYFLRRDLSHAIDLFFSNSNDL